MTRQTVLVTGAASGIGAAVVRASAQAGTNVAALDLDAASVEALVDEVGHDASGAVVAIAADVRSLESVEAAFARCRATVGVPNAVLANAGIEISRAPHEMSVADWEQTLAVNLTGAFLTARAGAREMLEANVAGSLVCTSSPAAFVGFAGGGNAAYAASKGGLSAMVRSLALEYASHGIRVNAVVPGATDTPLLTSGAAEVERSAVREQIIERARVEIPLGRLGAPVEIARAVLWLWSDAASYVTGSHLVVDGGILAKGANTF